MWWCMANKTYTYQVWSRDYMCFLDAMLVPIFRKRINKRKWFYSFWGHYHDPKADVVKYDKIMLERSGFKRVELIEID
jgi:hypothetical protein